MSPSWGMNCCDQLCENQLQINAITVGDLFALVEHRRMPDERVYMVLVSRLIFRTKREIRCYADVVGRAMMGRRETASAKCFLAMERVRMPRKQFRSQIVLRFEVTGQARYAWLDNPASILYNSVGLPATPFHTRWLRC
ncbi:hypothetical protein [Terriglobus tenax]|uniref:hypothetical protein n=1 Tax=Terriglobus tenax TaxID=1111115 RepID=UPI0021DFC4EE|nr:hypothetical protein [Terriglobus tenax]